MNDSVPNDSGSNRSRARRGPRSAELHDDDEIGRRLSITARAYTDWANERMATDIGLIPWVLLRKIERTPAPGLSQKDLASFFGVGGPTIVGHVDRLAAEGLVERSRDLDDRRISRLVITDAGRERVETGARHAREIEHELRAVLGERRLATFMSALRMIHTYVSTDEGGTR